MSTPTVLHNPTLITSARVASVAAFTVAAALHTAWGLGSAWPMRTRLDLADVVVGAADVPAAPACFAVVGLATAAGGLVSGASGTGTAATAARRVLAAVIAARGIAGGRAAAMALGMEGPSPRFIHLDNRVYRPLFLGTAAAVLATTLKPIAT